MTGFDDPNDQPPEPETDQERAFLAAYRALDEAERVRLWSDVLTLLDQQAARSASVPPRAPQESG